MPKLSIITCAYNEIGSIETVLARIAAVDLGPGWEKEVLVVDNCSTDGTREFLQHFEHPNFRILLNPRNLGKGGSIRRAIGALTGDYAVIQDADLEYHPNQLPKLLRKVEAGAVVVLGSRVLGGDPQYEYAYAYLGVRLLTGWTNLLYGAQLTDVGTAIKLVRTDILRSLNLVGNSFDLDFELVDKVLLAGYPIDEVALDYIPRTYAEGKKIKAWDGIKAMWVILRDRLGLSALYKASR